MADARDMEPLVPLRPYQQRIIQSESRLIAWLASRRIGKSFAVSLRAVLRSMGVLGAMPRNQYVFSPGVRQSIRFLLDCAMHLRAMEQGLGRKLIASKSATRIELVNGKEILALPNNVMSTRGYGGDVVFEEAGAIPNARELWRAARPIADPTAVAPEGHTFVANGTGMGDSSWFYEIMETGEGAAFERHRTTYEEALAEGHVGLPADVLRAEVGDDLWASEYDCQWIVSGGQFFPTELLESVLYQQPDMEIPASIQLRAMPYLPQCRPCAAGMDVAIRNHLSAIAEVSRSGDRRLWVTNTRSERGVSWDDQEAWVGDVVRRCGKIAIDASGLGDQFVYRLQKVYGRMRVERVDFNAKIKAEVMTGLRLAFERKFLMLPADDLDLRRSLMTIRRTVTTASNIRFDAEESRETGHADLAWGLGLALRAAGGAAEVPLGQHPVAAGEYARPHDLDEIQRMPERRGDVLRPERSRERAARRARKRKRLGPI